jgi:hypothetical protein
MCSSMCYSGVVQPAGQLSLTQFIGVRIPAPELLLFAGWSSGQLVSLISSRSQVQILLPHPNSFGCRLTVGETVVLPLDDSRIDPRLGVMESNHRSEIQSLASYHWTNPEWDSV